MKYQILIVSAIGLIIFGSGCASTQKSTMYTLSPGCEAPKGSDSLLPDKIVGIGRVTIPRRINRPVIVTNKNRYELEHSEFRRWGELPDDNLRSAIQRNLSRLLNSDAVVARRVEYPDKTDYNINIDVLDMGGELGKEARLLVNWEIRKSSDSSVISMHTSQFSAKLEDSDYRTYVAAQSSMVDKLSCEIADSLLKIKK